MKIKAFLLAAAASSLLVGCNQGDESGDAQAAALETEQQKISYILGSTVGAQFKMDEIELDRDSFMLGLNDVATDVEPRIPQEEVMELFSKFQQEQLAKQQAKQEAIQFAREAAAEENKVAGEAFMAKNGEAEGVVTLKSGLQYKVMTAGSGSTPSEADMVEVHYVGKLVDGTVFESSREMGETAKFAVNQVIPGWTEALQLMKEGALWELYIPPALAYGPTGAGQTIGPNSTLIFEVELLKVGAE